jgi:uncharacterized membrane protein
MTDYPTTTEDKTLPAIAYGLYLLAYVTGVTAIIGLIIAYAQRNSSGPVMRTHYTYLIRTFWLGILFTCVAWVVGWVLLAVGVPLSFILIGIPMVIVGALLLGVTAVWYGVRCVIGLVYLSRGEAHPRPYALLA